MTLPTLPCPIAMENRMLVAGGGTGISTYARGLREAIGTLTADPQMVSDRAVPDAPLPATLLGRRGRWLRALAPVPRRACAEGALRVVPDLFRLAHVFYDVHRRPLRIRLPGPPGIMHWTYPLPVHAIGWANLYTVHDLIPLTHPELTPIDGARHKALLDALLPGAAGIVTVSSASRDEIVDILGLDPARVHDCGQAAEPAPSVAPLPAGLEPGGYFVATGLIEGRKNLVALAEAHAASGTTLPLVLTGPDGADVGRLTPALTRPGVVRLGYAPEPVVRALIGNARALLMPSLAEGFGLPVAEAMALGTPVMTSNRGALAEVAADAALLIDPTDRADMTRAIVRLAGDDALVAALSEKGRGNVIRFTRARFAQRLASAYQSIGPRRA